MELSIRTTIRVADLRDAGAIAAVQVASWRTTYPGIVAQAYIDQLSVDERTLGWERRFRDEARTLLDAVVAETASGKIVGFASGGRIREPEPGFDAELYAIYLLEEAQGRGIGRRLVADWARRAAARGLQSAVVRVLAKNPACGFYERLGARRVKDGLLEIHGQPYAEIWYGWDDLGALAARAQRHATAVQQLPREDERPVRERPSHPSPFAEVTPHPRFRDALAALDAGDVERLRGIIVTAPDVVHARTNLDPRYGYFAGATLLHHVAGNPWRDKPLPRNIVDIARLLLESGAAVNAETLGAAPSTTMGLVTTGKQASDMGVTGPLMDLLLEFGAELDVTQPGALDASLANHAPRAAEKMIELGAEPDLFAVAGLGKMERLRASFDDDGRLRSRPQRHGKTMDERDAIGLALLYAYVRGQHDVVDFLLEKDGNWNMTGVNNGTVLHRAAWDGDLAMVKRLVAKGADMNNRDNPFHSTPLSWAQHNVQTAVFDWMRAHCRIDLHEAVCFDLREHVEARLLEDPASINTRIDQWDIPQCTPLHWAAWPYYEDVNGTHAHDPSAREQLVTLLLAHGADPNLVAGNGCTALDIAIAGRADGVAAVLEQHGGKRARDL